MTKWRRSPRELARAVEGIRSQLAPETLLANVQQVWQDAVGSAIAAEAKPTAERGGVLVVSCSSSVWAQELDLMAPGIIERVNGLLGAPRIIRLRCVSVPPASR